MPLSLPSESNGRPLDCMLGGNLATIWPDILLACDSLIMTEWDKESKQSKKITYMFWTCCFSPQQVNYALNPSANSAVLEFSLILHNPQTCENISCCLQQNNFSKPHTKFISPHTLWGGGDPAFVLYRDYFWTIPANHNPQSFIHHTNVNLNRFLWCQT